MKKNKTSSGSKVAGGILAVAAVVGAAGAYFLYGSKDAKKHRAKITGWALKAKGEVLDRLSKLKTVSEKDYHKVVETVVKKYHAVKNADPREVAQLLSDLKSYWNHIKKEASVAKGLGKKVTARARKIVKKGVKKATS